MKGWGYSMSPGMRYQITATPSRPGGPPARWMRFSGVRMTPSRHERLLARQKGAGQLYGESIQIEDFRCINLSASEEAVRRGGVCVPEVLPARAGINEGDRKR